MRCADCRSEGGWYEHGGVRFFRADARPPDSLWVPCPGCGGCGVSSCCEGALGLACDVTNQGSLVEK